MSTQEFPQEEKKYLTMVKEANSSPEKYRECILKAFATFREMDRDRLDLMFSNLFSHPSSEWVSLLKEKDELIQATIGDEEYRNHPYKEKLDVMIFVKLGELAFMRHQAQLAVKLEEVLGEISPERKVEILRKQLISANIIPTV